MCENVNNPPLDNSRSLWYHQATPLALASSPSSTVTAPTEEETPCPPGSGAS